MAFNSDETSIALADRETEVHLALGVILGAQRGGGHSVVFEGPRGVGKTALLEEIVNRSSGLMPEALICRARFRSSRSPGAEFVRWAARLAAAAAFYC